MHTLRQYSSYNNNVKSHYFYQQKTLINSFTKTGTNYSDSGLKRSHMNPPPHGSPLILSLIAESETTPSRDDTDSYNTHLPPHHHSGVP